MDRFEVAETIGDGLLDQYELAYPMFREAGLKATFFIIGSKIGNPDGMRSCGILNLPNRGI